MLGRYVVDLWCDHVAGTFFGNIFKFSIQKCSDLRNLGIFSQILQNKSGSMLFKQTIQNFKVLQQWEPIFAAQKKIFIWDPRISLNFQVFHKMPTFQKFINI